MEDDAPRGGRPASSLDMNAALRADAEDRSQCYVLGMAMTRDAGGAVTAAASLSNNRIKLYSAGGGRLAHAGTLSGHQGRISSQGFASPTEPHLLFSSSCDGTVRSWDLRSGKQAERFAGQPGQPLWSFAVGRGGQLVAGGGNGEVLIWDRRRGKRAACFDDSHAEDVTQLAFHPQDDGWLVTGSEDGLLCVFDLSRSLSEDDDFRACLNLMTAVGDFGFYGAEGESLWCRSCTESLHLWDWRAASRTDDEADVDGAQEAKHDDAREAATAALAASPMAQTMPEAGFVIGCHYDSPTSKLWLIAGTASGEVAFLPVLREGTAVAVDAPGAVLAGGHAGVVRSVLWPIDGPGTCLTGGEDSRICLWGPQGSGWQEAGGAAGAHAPEGGALGKRARDDGGFDAPAKR
ncbi:unnamed protein product [Pedinophyceae sp. YPF-701]|nr:unnamed protein product [Pedinophyceae sp. YPF-701]